MSDQSNTQHIRPMGVEESEARRANDDLPPECAALVERMQKKINDALAARPKATSLDLTASVWSLVRRAG